MLKKKPTTTTNNHTNKKQIQTNKQEIKQTNRYNM